MLWNRMCHAVACSAGSARSPSAQSAAGRNAFTAAIELTISSPAQADAANPSTGSSAAPPLASGFTAVAIAAAAMQKSPTASARYPR